jgi:1-aminocyclopropane-1-carboxylate deaminase/D-cysteine desulfhydrase-like pyridoxal-dependent ACC family enzyme
MGGNKVRKLEFLIAEAQANGARMLVTTGAAQSNHCRQTAAAAAKMGYSCHLVLSRSSDESSNGNLLLDSLFGAEITWCERADREKVLSQVFESEWDAGKRPFLVPYGGSSPIGASAYAMAFSEMVTQGLSPDVIVFPSSSGGTQAGLALGAKIHKSTTRIMGISVDEPMDELKKKVSLLANAAAERMQIYEAVEASEVLVNDHYIGPGYGVLSALERDAIRLFARKEGLLLDPVYTGRAAGGLIDMIQKGVLKSGEQVLFWHTGGIPALFASQYENSLT